MSQKFIKLTAVFLTILILGGCTTTDKLKLNQIQEKLPLKILLVQTPIAIKTEKLQTVLEPEEKKSLSKPDQIISAQITHAQNSAELEIKKDLKDRPDLFIIKSVPERSGLVKNIQGTATLSQEEANSLRKQTGADAVLKFKITDYGLTPKSWRTGYIAFEVTSTAAVAGFLVYSGTIAAKTVAGGYLAQEAVEETAEGYAGFWALNEVCRPVRIEAELIQLKPVEILWKGHYTGLDDVKLGRLVKTINKNERYLQLDKSTTYAAKGLISDLSKSLNK